MTPGTPAAERDPANARNGEPRRLSCSASSASVVPGTSRMRRPAKTGSVAPDGVQIQPAAGHRRVQFALRQVPAAAASCGQPQMVGESARAHAEDVQRRDAREPRQQVRSRRPAAPHRVVDDDGRTRFRTGPQRPRVDDVVLDHLGRSTAVVPHQPIEVGHMDKGDVGPVGEGVAGADGGLVRAVVLDVHGRYVDAGPATRPPLGQCELVRPLKHHQVDVRLAQPGRAHLAHRLRPPPGPRPAQPVRTAVGRHGHQKGVRALDERRQP